MKRVKWSQFRKNESAAVAPTIALSLFALIAVGGVGFDYARMAAMDSELQNAADQAALAAATQLDGQADATKRAEEAASGLVSNSTLFANDGAGTGVTIATVNFFSCTTLACRTAKMDGTLTKALMTQVTRDDSSVTDDAQAGYVEVTVGARTAEFALTPIVSALNSGAIDAAALAGLGSSICKSPPVMFCNPSEPEGNDLPNYPFNVNSYIGSGLNLVSVGNGSGFWSPGNFGYLSSHGGSNGTPGLREALGWDALPGDCISGSGVDTKPGATVDVTDSLNTRFDVYQGGPTCPSGGTCSPSVNSVKDLIKKPGTNGNSCKIHNQGWQESSAPYLAPSATTAMTNAQADAVKSMGHPRDMCHAISSNGSCTDGRLGDGIWDINAYFRINYGSGFAWAPAMTTAYGTSDVTRYQVYLWEIAQTGTHYPRAAEGSGMNTLYAHRIPVCGGPGLTPSANTVDRRRLSVAVINCEANEVSGSSTGVPVLKWVDLFLVEPSYSRARTGAGDVYAEIIGETSASGTGATVGQTVARNVPYLIE